MAFETITLEANELRFRCLTAGDGAPVLCLHGFPDHYESFRHQLPALANAGYRAFAPMMRGYEPSSQPGRDVAAHHPMRLASDVVQWARTLGGGEPIHLVGHDWGAIAGALACLVEPTLFRSFTSIAIANFQSVEDGIRHHPIQLRNSWYILFFQLRGIADTIVARNDFAFIERLWRDWSPGWDWEPDEMERLKQTFRQPGVAWSALAYYRAMMHPFLEDSKRTRELTRAPTHVPTLTVTGADDGCMDTRLFDYIDPAQYPKGVRTERFEGAGHFVHQEKPEAFNPMLVDWLRRCE
ncbi:MAG: alpha/beta hydrolase [Candidatus Binatia bacterium]|nr:alpha/beta hydrolase [Candidatus Binatia bacterium]